MQEIVLAFRGHVDDPARLDLAAEPQLRIARVDSSERHRHCHIEEEEGLPASRLADDKHERASRERSLDEPVSTRLRRQEIANEPRSKLRLERQKRFGRFFRFFPIGKRERIIVRHEHHAAAANCG